MRQTCDQPLAERIGNSEEHDRYGAGRLQEAFGRRRGRGDEYVGLQSDQLFCECLNSDCVGIAPAIIDSEVASIRPAELLKALLKYGHAGADIGIAFRNRHQHADTTNSLRLLRACRERPRRRAAWQRDEGAAPHSISASARSRNGSGIVSPMAFAVFRLTIGTSLCRTKLEGEIAAFDVAEFAQSFAQLLAERFRIRSRQDERSDPRRSALLRARRERPRSCAAEQRDELGASYSYHFQARQMGTSCTESVRDALAQTLGFVIRSRFTRSPRRRAVGTILGWLDPNTLAVVRFRARWNLVGCSTGRSAGLVPRRILSTNSAARRYRSVKLGP